MIPRMRGTFELVISAMIFACFFAVLRTSASEVDEGQYVDGQLLVVFADDYPESEWTELATEWGLSIERKLSTRSETYLLSVSGSSSLSRVYEKMVPTAWVEAVSYNFKRKAALAPNDPYFSWESLWGHENAGNFSGVVGADIDSVAAWDYVHDAGDIIVAVLDTGVRYTHEDLAANMWVNSREIPGNGIDDDGNDYIDDVYGINATNGNGDPMDDMGHGTHVAGILGSVGNNGVGVVGVAWKVQIMALKFLDSNGDGTDADAIECINYARENGADIINNSWGGGNFNAVLERAISGANDDGIFFVAAAGNSNVNTDDSPNYPASYDVENVVSVAATNRNDELADFSSFGESSVDIAAPGEGIYSTYGGSDSDYRTLNGSSMATPFVSGALALLKTKFPSGEMATLLNRLYAGADPLPSLARRCRTGARLNLNRALEDTLLPPLNDSISNPILLTRASAQSASFNTTASREPLEPSHDTSETGNSVWWRWTAPNSELVKVSTVGSDFASLLSVYKNDSLESLILISKGIAVTDEGASISFSAMQDEDYFIVVDGIDGESGNISLTVTQTVSNDDFESAEELKGLGVNVEVNNGAATAQTDEQPILERDPERSLWWKWVSPVNDQVAVTTSGSNSIDTLLAVYKGDTVGELSLVASDHDSGPGFTSLVTFQAEKGVEYKISVDSWNGEIGDVSLSVLNGENDDFYRFRRLVGSSLSDLAHSGGASKEVGEPEHAGNVGGRSLWWRWEATRNGQATINTFGSDFDTLLAVYEGSQLLDLVTVASSDDLGGLTSQVSFDVSIGDVYYIAVDGQSGFSEAVSGKVHLNIHISGDPSSEAPIIETLKLPIAVLGQSYATTLSALNIGSWTSVQGLPDGISFDVENSSLEGIAAESGTFEVEFVASNAEGFLRVVLLLTVVPSEHSPVIELESDRAKVFVGDPLSLVTSVFGNEDISYQWFKDGLLLVGENKASLELLETTYDDGGVYQLVASNSYGAAVSERIEVFINHDTLVNISTRGFVRNGHEVMIAGFVITGDEPRDILVRAVGPTLSYQGVDGVLEDPRFIIYSNGEVVSESDNWADEGARPELEDAFASLGAFGLNSDKEAAALTTLDPGIYTVVVFGADGGEGTVLTEVYDADRGTENGTRLINVSTRLYVSTGSRIAIAGFVVDGENPKKVVIRALGPGLIDSTNTVLTAETVLPDPFIMLYGGPTFIKANDDWSKENAEDLELIFEQVGAKALARGSYDAAMVITLPPGQYSVWAWDLDGNQGISLVEVYEVLE